MVMTIYATTNQHQVRSLLIGCLKNCNNQQKFSGGNWQGYLKWTLPIFQNQDL